jgi:glutamine amidotransferase-like protein
MSTSRPKCGSAPIISTSIHVWHFRLLAARWLFRRRSNADNGKHDGCPESSGAGRLRDWIDPEVGIALGQRRLAIIDLSSAGHQPMHSSDRRFVITYNGECYNFVELRRELAALGASFEGQSDTEVVVNGHMHWGVNGTISRLIVDAVSAGNESNHYLFWNFLMFQDWHRVWSWRLAPHYLPIAVG